MSNPGVDTAAAMWQALWDIIKAEMADGGRLNGISWTSPVTGEEQTTTLADVRKSAHLWTKAMPAAGVQLETVADEVAGGNRHDITASFLIVAWTRSAQLLVDGQKRLANLDDAMAELQALISDGTGKGFASIFRSIDNYTLGGTAGGSRITRVEYASDVGTGETPEIFAIANIFVTASKRINLV